MLPFCMSTRPSGSRLAAPAGSGACSTVAGCPPRHSSAFCASIGSSMNLTYAMYVPNTNAVKNINLYGMGGGLPPSPYTISLAILSFSASSALFSASSSFPAVLVLINPRPLPNAVNVRRGDDRAAARRKIEVERSSMCLADYKRRRVLSFISAIRAH